MNIKNFDLTGTAACIASGLMLTSAFPAINIQFIAWTAFTPLFFAVKNQSFAHSFRLGLLTGLSHFLTLMHWLTYTMQTYGGLPYYLSFPVLFLLSFYFSLYTALFAGIISRFSKKPILILPAAPILWVSLEYIRASIFSGFPWGLIGYSQFKQINIIQISELLGVYGVSFLVMFANAVLFIILLYLFSNKQRKAILPAVVFILILCTVWLYGKYKVDLWDKIVSSSPTIRIALIQGNIEQNRKWAAEFRKEIVDKYISLSKQTADNNPDIIVWPETAVPFFYEYNRKLTQKVKNGIKATGANLLTGSNSLIMLNNKYRFFNSAYLTDRTGETTGRYDKKHLVPFGEYVPLKKWFPFIGKFVAQVGDFLPGDKANTLKVDEYRVGVLICGEIIFPDICRKITKNNADLLINITNDAWFGDSGAPFQHFSMAVFRAVENRRSIARCANTGISGFINPVGRIIQTSPIFKNITMIHDVPVIKNKESYIHAGDNFAILCIIISVSGLAYIFITKRRRKKTNKKRL